MKKTAALALSLFLTMGVALAETPKESDPPAAKPAKAKAAKKAPAMDAAAISAELEELRQTLQDQQEQIQKLKDALAKRDEQINEARETAASANARAAEASAKASEAVMSSAKAESSATALNTTVADLKASSETLSSSAGAGAAPEQKEQELGPLATQKIKLGVTFFGDYAFYTDTGFGPQFITQINQPGPGNDHFNSFDITRTYLNFFYTPNDWITLRVTPNIYRMVDGTSGSTGNGNGASVGGSTNGNLGFRLKYAYVDFKKLFSSSEAFKKDVVTFGSTTIPLVDWEEGLYGYRYTSLTPWNYLSLSSTYVGAKIHGPIEMNGKEFLDYDIGVFNTASFHSIEQNDKKQIMGRMTFYPMGTTKDRTGFGITAFDDYGYTTKFPDTRSIALNRLAVIVFYQTPSKSAQIAGEYDLGRNAFGTGNMFSGAAPVSGGTYDALATIASSVLGGEHTRQQGFDFFGHVKLGDSPFALFGLYQYFQPNTNYNYAAAGFTNNPLDFDRTVGGISYAINPHLDMALQDSNFHYIHPQGVPGAVDTNAIFLNFQFNY
jgi:hypothetical protein